MTGNSRAVWSVAVGVLATLTMPIAISVTRYSNLYELLYAGFAIPLAAGLGIAAVALARRARALDRASLGRAGGLKAAGVGHLFGILGLCSAASATVALAVYGVLLSLD